MPLRKGWIMLEGGYVVRAGPPKPYPMTKTHQKRGGKSCLCAGGQHEDCRGLYCHCACHEVTVTGSEDPDGITRFELGRTPS